MQETKGKLGELRQEDRMMALGRISTGIAHEVRNPLSTINVYVKILRSMLSGSDDKETLFDILNEIESASERIETVVRRTIDFARHRKPELALSDINRCIQDAVSLASLTLQNDDILLKTNLGEKIPTFLFENQSMTQVFLNLISNGAEAMKNTAPPKQLAISSRFEKGVAVIRVSDSGQGIRPEDLEKIFDPFFTTKPTGLGVGLSLCDRIVTDHGGSLTLSSNHQGTEFCVVLPVTTNIE